MTQKVILVADPGIDTAFAVALALHDPRLEVLGLVASPGNVGADQATENVQTLINQLDPPRWPRIGAAPQVEYEVNGRDLHGPNGLGGIDFPSATLHQPTAGDKLIVEILRQYPREVTVVNLGPLTVLARAIDRDPEVPHLAERFVILGGSWHEPGNATAVAEFHFYCDPPSARQVLKCGATISLMPLDLMRKVVFSPSDLLELPAPETPVCQFLRQIVPFGIRATSNLYGIEGFHLKDVLGVAAVTLPKAFTYHAHAVDVETRGELTRGMSIVDARVNAGRSNVDLATGIDITAVRDYISRTLRGAAPAL
jgi:inosine-uridine nucleoside N-ribohydrolase